MKLAVMQPYFLPYIGYFQLIDSVDEIVLYDNIKYTKKGWINRNRRLQDGAAVTFSIALKKGSDALDVVERELAADFNPRALLLQFRASYAKAPYFSEIWSVLERILLYDEVNLFRYIHNSIVELTRFMGIETTIRVSSDIDVDHELKGQDRVIALCRALGAETYINPIGGLELYDRAAFAERGVVLQFLQSSEFEYEQRGSAFVPWLSIVDVLMFNAPADVRAYISTGYGLV